MKKGSKVIATFSDGTSKIFKNISELAKETGLSTGTIYSLIETGEAYKPIRKSKKTCIGMTVDLPL